MLRHRIELLSVLLGVVAVLACGADDRSPKAMTGTSGSLAGDSGEGNTAGDSSLGGAASAGTAGVSEAAGSRDVPLGGGNSGGNDAGATSATGGSVSELETVCGNGVRESGEACDGNDVGGYVCADLGYDSGSLSCRVDCTMDESDCVGIEQCDDGLDNDGDRLFDCEDSDCAADCATSCASPRPVPAEGWIHGALIDHAADLASSCSFSGEEKELVYSFTAPTSGTLVASVLGPELKILSVRTSCEDASSELGCSGSRELEVDAEEGRTYFVVVEGNTPDMLGEFDLSVHVREVGCGNLAREVTEGCDDGNQVDGDGCSATCQVEASEQESNRTPWRANHYVSPFYGTISGWLDQDHVSFQVPEPPVALRLRIFDFGDGACATGELDSTLTLLAPGGMAALASDDDGGIGYCSQVDYLPDTPVAGEYFAVVAASPSGSSFEFPYVLTIYAELCGNGVLSPEEECDDENQDDHDGCSALCLVEE